MNNKLSILLSLTLALPASVSWAQTSAVIDCDTWEDYPLVKKIGLYQTPLATAEGLRRDLPKMSELQVRGFRYEMAWGKDELYAQPGVTGTKDNLVYHFEPLDWLLDKAGQYATSLIISQGYTPDPIKQGNDWQKPPTDLNVWAQINKRFVEHYRERGYHNHYIEVWNEPDLTNVFFRGTLNDYLEIYEYAAPAIREGDPDVKIGGPAGAGMGWHQSLVTHAKNKHLPLDFISGHAYGGYAWQLDGMRNALKTLGNKQGEMLLTEYAPYGSADIKQDGPVEQAEAALTFIQNVEGMLRYPDLTHVTWAQYIDPVDESGHTLGNWGDKMGLVDGNYGCRKALFNAFKFYGWMPERRNKFTSTSIAGLASSDDDCVTIFLYNDKNGRCTTNLTLQNIPFSEGYLEVYRIDTQHNSWYELGTDALMPDVAEEVVTADGTLTVTTAVAPRGVSFIRLVRKGASAQPFPRNDFATVVRTHQWYDERSNTAPYAYFDPQTWTAQLGLCQKDEGRAIVGVTAEHLPLQFTVKSRNSGNLQMLSAESGLSLRIDFQGSDGSYTSAVVFHGGLYSDERSAAPGWGTGRTADATVRVGDFGQFHVDLTPYLPTDFSGRAIITFDQQATGKESKATIQLLREDTFNVSAPTISGIRRGSAELSAFVTDIGNVAEAGFAVSTDGDPAVNGILLPAEPNATGTIVSQATSLEDGRDYYVKAYVKGKDGKTVWSTEATFYAPGRQAEVTTMNTSLSSDKRQVTLRARVTDEGDAKVTDAGFVWTLGEGVEPTLADTRISVPFSVGIMFQYKLALPETEADYKVRAYAVSRNGISYGETREFSTIEPSAIATVQTGETTTVSAYDLSGRRGNLKNGARQGVFIVKYRTDDGTETIRKIVKK